MAADSDSDPRRVEIYLQTVTVTGSASTTWAVLANRRTHSPNRRGAIIRWPDASNKKFPRFRQK